MCCCAKPNKNGEPGYNWNPPAVPGAVYPANAPDLPEGWTLLHDEPGRCSPTFKGKPYRIDHHSHHYRVMLDDNKRPRLFVRHGGGTEEIGDSYTMPRFVQIMAGMDSDERFVFIMALGSALKDAARKASTKSTDYWRTAAAEKRIKTRKRRGSDEVDAWIELTPAQFEGAEA